MPHEYLLFLNTINESMTELSGRKNLLFEVAASERGLYI
jgi:hypothetical protein